MTETRVPRTATVIESKLKENSAQVIVDKGVFLANQQGSGIVVDENIVEVGAEDIRLTAKHVEVDGSPLNPKLMHSEKLSAEMVKGNRLNCYAGEMVFGAPVAHTHRYPFIQVPPVYKSHTLQTLKKIEKAAGVVDVIGTALAGKVEAKGAEIIGDVTARATEEVSKIIENNIPELGQFDALGGGSLPTTPMDWYELIEPIVKDILKKIGDGGLF